MFISFFESFKYMGHMWPIAILRIFVGVMFLRAGLLKLSQNFLNSPVLQEILQKWQDMGPHSERYTHLLQTYVVPHWQVFSYLVVIGEISVGVCFIIGLFVRPAALVAMFLNFNFMLATGPDITVLNRVLVAVNGVLFLVGAGRCIGFDYYFYKRLRGYWW